MEDGDVDFSNPEVFSDPTDSFFDEILKDTHACTHTHICNPPGSTDLSHTHTCYHVHQKIFSPSTDETTEPTDETTEPTDETKHPTKKRSLSNRVAVKKYREKKKARTASLEEEVAHLRAVNQQLMKRLQGQAALEAEVARLRCLLVDIRGRIEGEIGSFPYQKPSNVMMQGNVMGGINGGGGVLNSCEVLRCDERLYCLEPGMQGNGQGCGPCEIGSVQCMGSNGVKDLLVCGGGNRMGATGCLGNVDTAVARAGAATEG